MKKLAIAGASVVLAVLPVAGVFAESSSTVDWVTLTVNASCTMSATSTYTEASPLSLGSAAGAGSTFGGTDGVTGTAMTISCNNTKGWTLKTTATPMTMTGGKNISFGAFATSGASVWSAQLAVGGADASAVSLADGWGTFAGTKTGAETTVLQNTSTGADPSTVSVGVYGVTVTPSYKAYVATNQEAGTYKGSITYAFAEKS